MRTQCQHSATVPPYKGDYPTRYMSFQHPVGVLVCSLFLGVDTALILIFTLASSNFASQFLSIVCSIALIPLCALTLTILRPVMRARTWDFFILYPFMAISVVAATCGLYIIIHATFFAA